MRWLWHPNAQASQPAPSAFRTRTATRHMRVLRRACAALLLLLGPRLERALARARKLARCRVPRHRCMAWRDNHTLPSRERYDRVLVSTSIAAAAAAT
jgi:hypothetical protein